MATRNRVQRGEDAKAVGTLEGRVRKWRKIPMTGDQNTWEGKRLIFKLWRPLEERATGHVARPNMAPVENPNSKPARPPRFVPAPGEEGKLGKRGRASLSALCTEDRSATPAYSEGVSAGATQRTEGTSAPKVIRFKLKSSTALAAAGAGAAGGTPAPAAGDAPPLSSPLPKIRIKVEPRPSPGPSAPDAQQPLPAAAGVKQEPGAAAAVKLEPAGMQQGAAAAAPAIEQPGPQGGDASIGGGASEAVLDEDDFMAELLGDLEPQEPLSPRNLDELIPDLAAAQRHDATAVLLGAGWGQAPPQQQQPPPDM